MMTQAQQQYWEAHCHIAASKDALEAAREAFHKAGGMVNLSNGKLADLALWTFAKNEGAA